MHALRRPWSRLVLTALVAAVAMLAAGHLPVEAQKRDFGRTTIPVPERTDDGSWEGTWYYVSRDMKLAVWIRENEGEPQIKIRFQGTDRPEAFTTDWNARAEYEFRGTKGLFHLDFDEQGKNLMTGTWNWRFGEEGSARIETGRFDLFRTGGGRQMAMHLQDFERVYESPQGDTRLPRDQVRTFVKASQFQALWIELPF